MEDQIKWNLLPEHIVVNILSYLTNLSERHKASQTCHSWSSAFSAPHLWKTTKICFFEEGDSKQLESFDIWGRYICKLEIEVDQSETENRLVACRLLRLLSELTERRLERLKIKFTGQNPCMYSGQEFIDSLSLLFSPRDDANVVDVRMLKEVDLRGLLVTFDGQLLDLLSKSSPDLEVLNIQNNVLVCEVLPSDILRLMRRCRKLRQLAIFSCSCSDEVLLALTELPGREPLRNLSIFCRREEKYVKDVPSSVWRQVVAALPNLRVTLAFDHTCPLMKVSEVMKPEIPISVLRLETATDLWKEVQLACDYYKTTLEKLIVKSPPTRNRELDVALVDLAKRCHKLRSLHVLYVLEENAVKEILELHPMMRENGTYTLKFVAEPHPWMPGKDFW